MLIPKGFNAAGSHVGLKAKKKDLSLISSDIPCTAAAAFTTNIVKAAPVLKSIEIIESGAKVSGIVINSGNANACTGQQGLRDAEEMIQAYKNELNCETVLVCSTGVIGVPLEMDIMCAGIKSTAKQLSSEEEGFKSAAEAIMTTDTFPKTAWTQINVGGKTATLLGMAKGSGMIHPNMATLLSCCITDINISRPLLDKAVKKCIAKTFNMISVDGDTSTNDTFIALANGACENPLIEEENNEYTAFCEALTLVVESLAKDIAKDGEGATKLMEVCVKGAKTEEDAKKIAKSVISSSLFKAALFGADANWGRVLCAMGYSGGDFDPFNVDIFFKSPAGSIQLMDKGAPVNFSEEEAKKILSENEIFISICLNQGKSTATAWGCDLTYDYVKINGDYRS